MEERLSTTSSFIFFFSSFHLSFRRLKRHWKITSFSNKSFIILLICEVVKRRIWFFSMYAVETEDDWEDEWEEEEESVISFFHTSYKVDLKVEEIRTETFSMKYLHNINFIFSLPLYIFKWKFSSFILYLF